MRTRIAFISEHASPLACLGGVDSGGQNVYVAELARALARKGKEVDIFTRRDDLEADDITEVVPGVRVIHVTAGPAEILPKEDIFGYMDEFAGGMEAFILAQRNPYALIHAHFWMSGYVAKMLKERLAIPYVITYHALGITRRFHQKKDDRFPSSRIEVERQVGESADSVIAVCPQDKEDLMQHYQVDEEKIVTIPCGVNTDDFYPADRVLSRMIIGVDTDEKVILQLGRMVPRKGVDNVIKALHILKANYNEHIRLVIVGGETEKPNLDPSEEMMRLRLLVDDLGLSSQVIFAGRKNRDVLKYFYSAADVFITTPWYEPFGITPLESMACGTPVIGSQVGGIKFSVQENETGYLVEPEDATELAHKIHVLFEEPRERKRMAENGKKRIAKLFTWDEVARKMNDLYVSVSPAEMLPESEEDQLSLIEHAFKRSATLFLKAGAEVSASVLKAAQKMTLALAAGGKVLVCGNGGSAAESQHLAAELVGRFNMPERPALPALCLAADSAILTAWANDFSFDQIFSRQVEAFGKKGDVLVCLTTSGSSANVLNALTAATELGLYTIALTGAGGAKAAELADLTVAVPSLHTPCIQEIHLHIIHTLCELIEKSLFAPKKPVPSASSMQETSAYLN